MSRQSLILIEVGQCIVILSEAIRGLYVGVICFLGEISGCMMEMWSRRVIVGQIH